MSRPVLGPTQLPFQWVPGFFPGGKRPGREVNYPSPSRAENKNEWSDTSAPPVRFYGMGRATLQYYTYSCTLSFFIHGLKMALHKGNM